MPYRIKAGLEVLLINENDERMLKTFTRVVDFTKSELVASPLDEHHKDGIRRSTEPGYKWGFTIKGKWENVGDWTHLYTDEVHVTEKAAIPKDANTVIVPGSGKNEYTVTLDASGNPMTCSCPAFRFRGHVSCKHMDRVKRGLV